MINFGRRIGDKTIEKKIDPIAIYSELDRESDKGPLRKIQEQILTDWYTNYQQSKDVIIKLNTGQGKTLIGLLTLQSLLNQGTGPAIYLCPSKYLVEQTQKQAKSFGISYVDSESLVDDFTDAKKIWITTISKLFNGKTIFQLGTKSLSLGSVVMDDSHACIAEIRKAFTVSLRSDTELYGEIFSMFSNELERQAMGTFNEVKNKQYDASLAVPYWEWHEKIGSIAEKLAKYSLAKKNDSNYSSLVFAWNLIKDDLNNCLCVISGHSLEISPYIPSLKQFRSYTNARHRIYMSASLIDDAFFIKGLDLKPDTVKHPLTVADEPWSGEKMILIPSTIDKNLKREDIIARYAPRKSRGVGIVILVPSNNKAQDWQSKGSILTGKETIGDRITNLKKGNYDNSILLVNRYDGIDLPDNSCRILIIDSIPHTDSLSEKYEERCRASSNITKLRKVIRIEQGLGRGVRGEKDYCAIILTGEDLEGFINLRINRTQFSSETRKQIEIGLQISEIVKADEPNLTAIMKLDSAIKSLLNRKADWKEFYRIEMQKIVKDNPNIVDLDILVREKKAEEFNKSSQYSDAVAVIQKLIDDYKPNNEDKGWYLQEIARYMYLISKADSNNIQNEAYEKNDSVFKPKTANASVRANIVSAERVNRIKKWTRKFKQFSELSESLKADLDRLEFGIEANAFEEALRNIGITIGYEANRPDKETKNGPDVLWKIDGRLYLMLECKNEVLETRKEITASETGQVNNQLAWFKKIYRESEHKTILIISTEKVGSGGFFSEDVQIMKPHYLKKFKENVMLFFNEFQNDDLSEMTEDKIVECLKTHQLLNEDIMCKYSAKYQQLKIV